MTKKRDLNEVKTEILSRVDVEAEYRRMGIEIIGRPNAKGWLQCRSPYCRDKNPSAGVNVSSGSYRGWFMIFNQANGGSIEQSSRRSFFDMAADHLPGMFGDFKQVLYHYAKQTGVDLGGRSSGKPPTEEDVQKCQEDLTQDVRDHLHAKRGLTDETLEKFKIGWHVKKGRNSIPVYDEHDNLVNIRYHNSKKTPKTLNTTGFGEARLWNLNELVSQSEGATIVITEGEFDGMLVEQVTELTTVSPTNGCKSFMREWVPFFKGYHVVIMFDCDHAGRDAVNKLVLPTFKKFIDSGDVLSIKVVWLYEKEVSGEKDFTDYIVKSGGSRDSVNKLILATEKHVYGSPEVKVEEATKVSSFTAINDSRYAGKKIETDLYIFGENSESYHAPTEFIVSNCPKLEKSKCHGRDDWDWHCDEPIKIPPGDRIQLAAVASSDKQMIGALRDYCCDKNQRPSITIYDNNRMTVQELFAHQVLSHSSLTHDELVEKAVYVMSGNMIPIGQYNAVGYLRTNPKNQKPTLFIDRLTPQKEDWQSFNLEKAKKSLRHIQKYKSGEILKTLSHNVTNIYQRDEIHLVVMLTLLSPRRYSFDDEPIRGWLNSVIIGDTGTGKTQVAERICNYAGVGSKISGMTSSRTGITYGIEADEKRGWRLKAGELLKMSKQALVIDESQDIEEQDLKTMAESCDSGRLTINRIRSKTYEAETRCLLICNPKMKYRTANQRTMDSFRYGCQSVMDIFPKMMLRRIDLYCFVASFDIKNKEDLYLHRKEKTESIISPQQLRDFIYYSWNLRPDQIYISDEITAKLKASALELSNEFGKCSDLPICYPEDFRKTFCRLVIAYAVFDLSSYDDFQTTAATETHILHLKKFLRMMYTAQNCRLNDYSSTYADSHEVSDFKEAIREIQEYFDEHPERHLRVLTCLNEILKLDTEDKEKVSQKYLSDLCECERTAIYVGLKFFIQKKYIKSERGYKPSIKLIRLKNYVEQNCPEFLKIDDE